MVFVVIILTTEFHGEGFPRYLRGVRLLGNSEFANTRFLKRVFFLIIVSPLSAPRISSRIAKSKTANNKDLAVTPKMYSFRISEIHFQTNYPSTQNTIVAKQMFESSFSPLARFFLG